MKFNRMAQRFLHALEPCKILWQIQAMRWSRRHTRCPERGGGAEGDGKQQEENDPREDCVEQREEKEEALIMTSTTDPIE